MELYLSKCSNRLNNKELKTEHISEYICLNPSYPKVSIGNKNIKVLMDSGAFQDRNKEKRITHEEALERQLKLEKRIGITSHRIVAYDFIDNVEETIKSNIFLSERRERLRPRQLVLMNQGKDVKEYLKCLFKTLDITIPGDCLGFGGVAPAGQVNEIKLKLLDIFKYGLPHIYEKQIKDIHVFGVGTFKILKEVRDIVALHELIYKLKGTVPYHSNEKIFNISCDTSSFEVNSVMGRVIDEKEEKWSNVYTKAQKCIDYHPCDLTHENMKKGLRIINKIC